MRALRAVAAGVLAGLAAGVAAAAHPGGAAAPAASLEAGRAAGGAPGPAASLEASPAADVAPGPAASAVERVAAHGAAGLPATAPPAAAPVADDDAALVQLGEQLFFDPQLSEPPGTACASCHDPARAFTGDNGSGAAVARGSRPGVLGLRNVPTLMYLDGAPPFAIVEAGGQRIARGGFFWDGRADTLAEQAIGPLFNPAEMNNPDPAAFARKLAAGTAAGALRRLGGAQVFDQPQRLLATVGAGLQAFQRSPRFAPFSSKFDAVLRGQARFTAAEARGRALFLRADRGNCVACHPFDPAARDPRRALFTDFSQRAIGVPHNPALAVPRWTDLGLCDSPRLGGPADRPWCGHYKVPTLRNVARTAPYMHNGVFASLREAVAFYASRDSDPGRWYRHGRFDDLPPALRGGVEAALAPYRGPARRPLLSATEVEDLVAFLHTLSDGWVDPGANRRPVVQGNKGPRHAALLFDGDRARPDPALGQSAADPAPVRAGGAPILPAR